MTTPTGTLFGPYKVIAPLGKGGMGEVCLAEDTRLQRKVALKILPSEFTANSERLRRFELEAKTASGLNHPNIITIYDIGQAHGTHFLATEYIEGATLRARLRRTKLSRSEALDIALQIADALAAAHHAGIIHRDIKPENVMIRHDGIVKVLDFGLAKLLEERQSEGATGRRGEDESTLALSPARPLSDSPTDPGTVMGTPQYMSPEQARGEELDVRTDIFSLGTILYEMLAGRTPFEGVNALDIISSILRAEPTPLRQLVPEVSRELEHIVSKALRKDREKRYQHVKDLQIDLHDLRRELEFEEKLARVQPNPPAPATVTIAEATQNRGATISLAPADTGEAAAAKTISSTKIILGEIKRHRLGVTLTMAGFLVAAVATFIFFQRTPALTDKDTVLLADFINSTGDTVFDGTLKQAFALQLEQSPFLHIFPDQRVRETLRFMNRSPNERVTPEVAREICERVGLKALLTGSISSLGRNYVIALEAINARTGDVLAREQAETDSKEQVLRTLAQAAAKFREKLGESLSSIQKFGAPIEEATTPSLEAFKAFSQGRILDRESKYLEAIPFYQRAIQLDPNFAFAHSRLAIMYRNSGQSDLATDYAQKAFALREHATEREKLMIALAYYTDVTRELDKQFEMAELWKRNYPREWNPPNSLAIRYKLTGEYEKAIAECREAQRRDPNANSPFGNMGDALIRLNRYEEAQKTYEQALQQKLDETSFHAGLYAIAFVQGNAALMKQQVDWTVGRSNEYAGPAWQAETTAFAGQIRQARDFTRRAVDLAERRNLKEVVADLTLAQALNEVACGLCKQAQTEATAILAQTRSRTALLSAARIWALCGDTNRAQALADEVTKRYPKDTMLNVIEWPVIRAASELQHNNPDKAIQHLQPASRYEGGSGAWQGAAECWPMYLRGQSYLQKRAGTEAATEFQKLLAHRGWGPTSVLYPLAQLGLARATALNGEADKARKAYEDFFALWKEADADLPVLIEAKKEYARLP
ncbi:MAG TPA: protein kinase [Blastocatellia bacterium]|nr:protein kinase [Blastocatellia bacterium]